MAKKFVTCGFSVALSAIVVGCGTSPHDDPSILQSGQGGGYDAPDSSTVAGIKHSVGLATGGQLFCSGTLISHRQVVTAAHCHTSGEISVVFGIDANDRRKLPGVFLTRHPEWNGSSESDVAIVQLNSPVPSNWGYVPATPATDVALSADERFTILGYGIGYDMATYAQHKANNGGSPHENREFVQKAFSANSRRYVRASFAGYVNSARSFRTHADIDQDSGGQTFSCYGDSGGGAFYERDGSVYWAGILSQIDGKPDSSMASVFDFCGLGKTQLVAVPGITDWLKTWRDPLRVGESSVGQKLYFEPKDVYCTYPNYDEENTGYRISAIEWTYGDYVSTVRYWYHLSGWADPVSEFQVPNEYFRPFVQRMTASELTAQDVAQFMTQGIAHQTADLGRWKIGSCFAK